MSAPTGYTTVSASNLKDATGTAISNATIWFQPADNKGNPISFRSGGANGPTTDTAVSTSVVDGAFTIVLADTTLTAPQNVGYSVTVTDNVTGKSLLGRGYECIQPSGPTWSLDTFVPNLTAQLTVIVGGQGPAGPPLTPKGIYSGTVTYAKGDVITLSGASYISLVDANTGNAPATSVSDWMLLSAKGANGVDGANGTVWDSRVLRTTKVEGIQLRDDQELFSDVGAGNVERIQIQYFSSPGAGASSETTLISLSVDGVKYTLPLGIFMLTYGYEDGDPTNDCFHTETLGFNKGTGYTFIRRIFIPYKYSCRIAMTYVAANIPAAYNAATAYAAGARVQYGGKTWVSGFGDTGHTPGVAGSWAQEYGGLFSQVEYRHGAIPAGLYPTTRNTFRCFSTTPLRSSSVPMLSTLSVLDGLAGPGELDSFFLAMKAPTANGASHLEGNPTITADGVVNAFGGTEDFFGGGWYAWPKQRTSNWGIARNGQSSDTVSTYWGCYRFWDGRLRYPFSSSMSISWPVGQSGESGSGWNIQAEGHVVAYTQAPYPAAHTSDFPLCLDYSAANLTGLANGDHVTSWADAAGAGGSTLAATTSYGYPIYHSAGLNGRPTVYCDKGAGTGIMNASAVIPHPHSDGFERTWIVVFKHAIDSFSNLFYAGATGGPLGRFAVFSDGTQTYMVDFPNARLAVPTGTPVAVAVTTSNSREKRFAMISDGSSFASDSLFGGGDSAFGAYQNGLNVGTDGVFGEATAEIACIRCYEGAADPETCKALLQAVNSEFGLA